MAIRAESVKKEWNSISLSLTLCIDEEKCKVPSLHLYGYFESAWIWNDKLFIISFPWYVLVMAVVHTGDGTGAHPPSYFLLPLGVSQHDW